MNSTPDAILSYVVGKYVEKLGWYLPEMKDDNCSIDAERLAYWLSQGAVMTDKVETLAKVVAPAVIKDYHDKKAVIQAKKTAKRRASKVTANLEGKTDKPSAKK
ncbi:MAG: hypothetical protein EBZ47_08495 [Chlamydiae bacterium]|nr:hypothetical protein [Chlamydiota bacterium]